MLQFRRVCQRIVALAAIGFGFAGLGCTGEAENPDPSVSDSQPADPVGEEPGPAEIEGTGQPEKPAVVDNRDVPEEPEPGRPVPEESERPVPRPDGPEPENPVVGDPGPAPDRQSEAGERGSKRSLAADLAALEVPPRWLDSVRPAWDTSRPWKEARLEIRRLLGKNEETARRQGVKLTWEYLQKGDIGNGHEYPMYTFLGGEPVWSVRAHQEFLAQPHENTQIHAHVSLASLYTGYGEFEKAKATLEVAINGLPGPPWRIMRKADLLGAFGDLYVAWGRTDEAKRAYAEAAALYPTAKPPYGQHLLPRRAAKVQAKLDLLTERSLESASLRDGVYRQRALGYSGDIHLTVTIKRGRIDDIGLRHQEKIDQQACIIIPRRIVAEQSLSVDGISGATITKDAIVAGTFRALKQAGLK